MSNARSRKRELDELLEEILTGAYGDEEQLWAMRQALEDSVRVPCGGLIAGSPVQVLKFDYDGNARRGLTVAVRRADGSKHVSCAADVVLDDPASHRYIDAYRQWIGLKPSASPAASTGGKSKAAVGAAAAKPGGILDAAVLSTSAKAARCRILGSGEEVTFRATTRLCTLVPGMIATIQPTRQWTYGGKPYLSGSIEATRVDAAALGLTPLRLTQYGDWDPAEEYWGEPGEPIAPWAKKIIKRGKRPRYEMEQVVPGDDPEDPWSDPILQAADKKDAGDYSGARDILMGLCRADLRCLDAHAHLGNLWFDTHPEDAIRHYEVGVRIGELSLPRAFDGVLPWGMIDNRPFLRCLHGYGLCLWRLERYDESAAVFERMLWMNPTDNQGIRGIIEPVRKRRAWEPED